MSVEPRFLQLQLAGFAAARQVGSQLPVQGLSLRPLCWKAAPNLGAYQGSPSV